MIGERKSNWTVIEEIGNSKKGKLWKCRCDCGYETTKDTGYLNYVGKCEYGSKQWVCRCACGKERIFNSSYLNGHGKRQATQCKQCELKALRENNKVVDRIPNRFWNKFLYTAKKREIEVHITKDAAYQKYKDQNGRCALSDIELSFTKLSSRYWRYTNASIDRIDSALPYALDNIQWLEKRINMMKQSYQQDEFITLCNLVAENKNV